MDTQPPPELTRELARELTAQVAPEELEFFDELVDSASKKRPPRGDHPMGFGIPDGLAGAVSVLLYSAAQVLMQMLWTAAKPALEELTKQGTEEVSKLLQGKFKEWIQSKFTTSTPVKLSAEERLEFIKKWAQEGARLGIPESELSNLRIALERVTQ